MFSDANSELLDYLMRLTGLPASQCQRLVLDVLAQFDDTLDEFVRRRHVELKARGLKNEAIYAQIRQETVQRRFAAPNLTQRQVRRIIYG